MPKFTISHEFNCDEDTFWRTFFDKTFNDKLYKEHLQFSHYEVVEERDTPTEVFRKVKGTPKMNLPGPVAKLLGNGFSYVEEGRLDKATKRWTWKMIPSALGDKLRNEGSMRIEKIGDSRIRRVAEITIEAKVFGVGGLIESSAEKQLREGWDASAPFFQKWIDAHK